MTHDEFQQRYDELLVETTRLLRAKANELLCSGAIDMENDAPMLPKVVLYAALEDVRDGWRPLSAEGRAMARNLRHF